MNHDLKHQKFIAMVTASVMARMSKVAPALPSPAFRDYEFEGRPVSRQFTPRSGFIPGQGEPHEIKAGNLAIALAYDAIVSNLPDDNLKLVQAVDHHLRYTESRLTRPTFPVRTPDWVAVTYVNAQDIHRQLQGEYLWIDPRCLINQFMAVVDTQALPLMRTEDNGDVVIEATSHSNEQVTVTIRYQAEVIGKRKIQIDSSELSWACLHLVRSGHEVNLRRIFPKAKSMAYSDDGQTKLVTVSFNGKQGSEVKVRVSATVKVKLVSDALGTLHA